MNKVKDLIKEGKKKGKKAAAGSPKSKSKGAPPAAAAAADDAGSVGGGDSIAGTSVDGNEEEVEEEEEENDDDEYFMLIKPQAPLTMGIVKDQFYENISGCHHHTDILGEEIMRDVSRMNYNPDPDARPPTPDVLATGPPPSKRKMPEIYPYAYRKLLELQVIMPTIYLTVDQVTEIIYYFPPNEGYLRVQFIQSVFSHIVDLENLHVIFDLALVSVVTRRVVLYVCISLCFICAPFLLNQHITLTVSSSPTIHRAQTSARS